MLKVAVANVPSPMILVFTPKAIHMVLAPLLEHDTVLLPKVAVGPAATLTLATSEDG
jgi:hypothetical protein